MKVLTILVITGEGKGKARHATENSTRWLWTKGQIRLREIAREMESNKEIKRWPQDIKG